MPQANRYAPPLPSLPGLQWKSNLSTAALEPAPMAGPHL
jgi:hypothetical protein